MQIKKRFNQLKDLSANEWYVLTISVWLLPLVALSLHIKGFKWTQTFLQKRCLSSSTSLDAHSSSHNNLDSQHTARSVARMVTVAANHGPYHANCLKKSLVIWCLLARRGIETELRIGVNKDGERFEAHAWVVFGTQILGDDNTVCEQYKIISPVKQEPGNLI